MTMLPPGDVAPIKRRVIAYVIDAVIGAAVGVIVPAIIMWIIIAVSGDVLTGLLVAAPLFSVFGLAWLLAYSFLQAGRGSVGMRLQGIRLAKATDGSGLGFGRALLRNVIWGLAASIVVGYFSALFDGSGRFQGWHDKVAGSVMLDARSAAHTTPYLDATQPRVVPDHGGRGTPSSMPGFAAPAPQTSMPGFAQPSTGFAPPAPAPQPEAAPAPEVAPAAQTDAAPAEDEFTEHTVLSPRISRDLPDDPLISFVPGVTQEPIRRAAPVEPAPIDPVEPVTPAASAPAGAGPIAPVAPVTDAAPSTPAAPPAPPATPAGVLTPVDDDEDIESTRISVPGHRLVFTWDDGQRATVSGRTVFGRNPEDGDGATNVAVRDETRSLSKTHFEAGANVSGGWVMDRQSTNGTTLVRDGVRIACPPGQRVPVRLGDALEIGDRIVTIGGYV